MWFKIVSEHEHKVMIVTNNLAWLLLTTTMELTSGV